MTTRETVVAAIANAIENNRVSCPQCEGGGRMYADGKPHYYSEGAPTKPCPNCEGTGRVEEQDVEDAIADAVMQLPALQLAEFAESRPEYRLTVVEQAPTPSHVVQAAKHYGLPEPYCYRRVVKGLE
jgi:excinuclease UvrABC ATPase subunit